MVAEWFRGQRILFKNDVRGGIENWNVYKFDSSVVVNLSRSDIFFLLLLGNCIMMDENQEVCMVIASA